jgi:hypothetical protein
MDRAYPRDTAWNELVADLAATTSPHCRFTEGKVIKHEALAAAGAVNAAGVFAVRENDIVDPSWAEGTAWRIGFIRQS